MHALRTVVVSATLGLALAGASTTTASEAAAPPATAAHQHGPNTDGLASTGYVLPGTPARVIARDAHALSTVGVDGVGLAADGASVEPSGADLTRMLARTHAQGLRAELLVSNYSNRLGDFDPRAAARLLRNPQHRDAVVAQLAEIAATQGWDGVQVDLESMDADDADGLTDFVQALRAALPPGDSLSIAVMATDDLAGYEATGYELAAISAAVDTVTLMTYDQHGPGWSRPGPIGALRWQQRCLEAALTAVPAPQLDLGVAGYGYTWRHRGGGQVTDAQARALVAQDGAHAVWHRSSGEWSARLSNGTRMWWSDHRSYRLRVQLALARGLHGVSIWRLGSSDPL